jgi:glyoxylase I family protein
MTNPILGRGGLHHICMKTRDWDRTMRFYREVLGFSPKLAWGEAPQRAVMLDGGDGNYVEVFEDLGYVPAPNGSLHHFALRTSRIDEVTERVRSAGYRITVEPKSIAISSTNGIGEVPVRISFCEGPNGESLEFLQNELT